MLKFTQKMAEMIVKVNIHPKLFQKKVPPLNFLEKKFQAYYY